MRLHPVQGMPGSLPGRVALLSLRPGQRHQQENKQHETLRAYNIGHYQMWFRGERLSSSRVFGSARMVRSARSIGTPGAFGATSSGRTTGSGRAFNVRSGTAVAAFHVGTGRF